MSQPWYETHHFLCSVCFSVLNGFYWHHQRLWISLQHRVLWRDSPATENMMLKYWTTETHAWYIYWEHDEASSCWGLSWGFQNRVPKRPNHKKEQEPVKHLMVSLAAVWIFTVKGKNSLRFFLKLNLPHPCGCEGLRVGLNPPLMEVWEVG